MGNNSSPPPAPSPQATATAQTGENISTAIANAALNRVPQTDQYGNTTSYNQTGTYTYTDPTSGQTYQLPQYSETTSMSPTNAKLYSGLQSLEGTNLQTGQNLATAAQGELSTPLNLSQYMTTAHAPTAADINSYAQGAWEQPFNQSWSLQQQQMDQKLADQGIAPGSAAYGNAEFNFTQNQQNAMDQYATAMYGTAAGAAQNAYTDKLNANAQNAGMATEQYNQPLNELAALQNGTQIAQPSFTPVGSTNIPTTDYASIQNNAYQQQLAQYSAQQQSNSAMYGGLFGLGGAAITAGGLLA